MQAVFHGLSLVLTFSGCIYSLYLRSHILRLDFALSLVSHTLAVFHRSISGLTFSGFISRSVSSLTFSGCISRSCLQVTHSQTVFLASVSWSNILRHYSGHCLGSHILRMPFLNSHSLWLYFSLLSQVSHYQAVIARSVSTITFSGCISHSVSGLSFSGFISCSVSSITFSGSLCLQSHIVRLVFLALSHSQSVFLALSPVSHSKAVFIRSVSGLTFSG